MREHLSVEGTQKQWKHEKVAKILAKQSQHTHMYVSKCNGLFDENADISSHGLFQCSESNRFKYSVPHNAHTHAHTQCNAPLTWVLNFRWNSWNRIMRARSVLLRTFLLGHMLLYDIMAFCLLVVIVVVVVVVVVVVAFHRTNWKSPTASENLAVISTKDDVNFSKAE